MCVLCYKSCDELPFQEVIYLFYCSGAEPEDKNDYVIRINDHIEVQDCLRRLLWEAYPWLENNLVKLEEYVGWLRDCCRQFKLVCMLIFV